MRRPQIRKALDEYADRQLPPAHDLWPAIRRQVAGAPAQTGRIRIEPAGRPVSRRLSAAALVVLLTLAALPFLNAPAGPGGQPTPQVAATVPATPPATPGAAEQRDYLATQLAQNLARQLGRDPATVNAAFIAAAHETIDEAVLDGSLSPEQGVAQKARAGAGFSKFLDGLLGDSAP
jgi:hypothetical protein